jgi:hypothetical protein
VGNGQNRGNVAAIVDAETCTLAIGPFCVALVASEAWDVVPAVRHAPGAWRPRGEPSAFDLIGSYRDPAENARLREALHQTTDYLLLARHPGDGALEAYLVELGVLAAPRGGGAAPLSEVLRRHERVVASSLDDELDGEALAARALTELAAKAGITEVVFDQEVEAQGGRIHAFARGRRWTLTPPRGALVAPVVAFLNTICRDLGVDVVFVELDRAGHVTWGRWPALARAARAGCFAAGLAPRWACQVVAGGDGPDDVDDLDDLSFAYVDAEVTPPTRIDAAQIGLAAARARISPDAMVARIVAAIVAVLARTYPGPRFDASYDPGTGWFEPLALVTATAPDVAWMGARGVAAELGDELAFRLTPGDVAQASARWPALDLAGVVDACERAIGWAMADVVAPDWLRGLPIELT